MAEHSSENLGSSKTQLCPEDVKLQSGFRTTLEKLLIGVCFVLLTVAVTFAVLFGVYLDKANDEVCKTRDCIIEASKISVKMDPTADPCQDFAQYACGGFYRDAVIPDDRTSVTPFSEVGDKNKVIIRRILEDPIKPEDRDYVKKMKTYYHDCMNEEKIEEVGLTPYTSSRFAGMWPTLNSSWDPSSFNLNDVIAEYESEFVEPIFSYMVSMNFDDSNKHKLHISEPSLSLSQQYLKQRRDNPVVMAYQQLIEDVSIEVGADPTTAKQDAKDLIDFLVALAQIFVPGSMDINKINNPSTLRNMTRDYPFIDFHRAIQAAFDTIGVTVPEDLDVINRYPEYFQKLEAVLDATDNRVIMNLFGYTHATYSIPRTQRIREIEFNFLKVLSGKKTESVRWTYCLSRTNYFIGHAVAKAFVAETFTEDSKHYMLTMIDELKVTFAEFLTDNSWMEPSTKQAAFRKLHHMRQKIGYPDEKYSHDDIERLYENYTVYTDEFSRTENFVYKLKNMEALRLLAMNADKSKWIMLPSEVNAYYAPGNNEIVFPAGILQPPFYSPTAPSSVNYGAIGGVIGHELTHGFDQTGSQFDYEGNLDNWWHAADLKEFEKRTQCIIDHYDKFVAKEIGMKLNGFQTARENTADIGGMKEAYSAYKKYAATQPKEFPLPGLGLTTDQQVFLAFSQLWCFKYKPASLRDRILNGVHAPGRFRIKGPLQKNADFAKAYKCPLGSPMNPVDKCSVW